jgi:hypothetical protein
MAKTDDGGKCLVATRCSAAICEAKKRKELQPVHAGVFATHYSTFAIMLTSATARGHHKDGLEWHAPHSVANLSNLVKNSPASRRTLPHVSAFNQTQILEFWFLNFLPLLISSAFPRGLWSSVHTDGIIVDVCKTILHSMNFFFREIQRNASHSFRISTRTHHVLVKNLATKKKLMWTALSKLKEMM